MRLHSIYKRNRFGNLKRILLVIVCFGIIVNLSGCVRGNRIQNMARESQEEEKMSDAMMQSIIDALEEQDTEALKKLFSPYALEKSDRNYSRRYDIGRF